MTATAGVGLAAEMSFVLAEREGWSSDPELLEVGELRADLRMDGEPSAEAGERRDDLLEVWMPTSELGLGEALSAAR